MGFSVRSAACIGGIGGGLMGLAVACPFACYQGVKSGLLKYCYEKIKRVIEDLFNNQKSYKEIGRDLATFRNVDNKEALKAAAWTFISWEVIGTIIGSCFGATVLAVSAVGLNAISST